MRHCEHVTAFGLLELLARCERLKELDISENNRLFAAVPRRLAGDDLVHMYNDTIPVSPAP